MSNNEEDYCTACLTRLEERRIPPSCEHPYCVLCFYLLIIRKSNCLVCDGPVYDVNRVFRDLRSKQNIAANTPNNS